MPNKPPTPDRYSRLYAVNCRCEKCEHYDEPTKGCKAYSITIVNGKCLKIKERI